MLHEWILQTLWQVKEASHKGPHTVWPHVHEMFRIGGYIEIASRLMFPGAGEGRRGVTANGYKISFQSEENVLDLEDGYNNLMNILH